MNIAFFAEQQLNNGVVWKSADIHYGESLDISDRNKNDKSDKNLLSRLLEYRGVTAEERKKFLNPSKDDFNNPFLFNNMRKAVSRIKSAINNGENILVFGDYDVDGMTSTAIMFSYLKRCGANVEYFIPDRNEDGYGLSISALERCDYQMYDLIITVDCGISSSSEITWLKSKNIDVIVTDHHTYVSALPDVYTIVSVSEPDESYPFKWLAGVGVAFKVVQALSIEFGEPDAYYDYIELAAIGTVADMVPLQKENRAIVSLGLSEMYNSKFKGVSVLLQHMFDCNGSSVVDTDALGFFCCPRFNAAGRVGDVRVAMQLFLSEDEDEAWKLVDILEGYNKLRKEYEREVFEEAEHQLLSKYDVDSATCFVLAEEGWNEGVIGIVASRLCEKYHCPSLLISIRNGQGKGSCRSVESIHLFECLEECSDLLEGFGGHRLAAGLTINANNIDAFESKLNNVMRKKATVDKFTKTIVADAVVDSNEMSISNTIEIENMSPFGEMNKRPLMYGNFFRILECKYIGQGNRHLKFLLSKGEKYFTALAFNKGDLMNRVSGCKYINTLFNYSINSWRGTDSFQMKMDDFKTLQWTRAMWAFYREFDLIVERFLSNEQHTNSEITSNGISSSDLSNAIGELKAYIDENVYEYENVNIFVNDLLSMDFVLKTVLKDIKFRCPVKLHYGKTVLDSSLLDIAPVDDSSSVATIHIYANVLPQECRNIAGLNVAYGKWYFDDYLDEIVNMIDDSEIKYIGVFMCNCYEVLPTGKEINCVIDILNSYVHKDDVDISFSKLESVISGALGKRINTYKLYRILHKCEQDNLYIIDNVRGDLLSFSRR